MAAFLIVENASAAISGILMPLKLSYKSELLQCVVKNFAKRFSASWGAVKAITRATFLDNCAE